ncbi:MAG TPA: efflux RND transporter periplasmic adaptor subunit [Anaerolineaceae bacterium]
MKKKGSRKWMIFVGIGVLAAVGIIFLVLPAMQARAAVNTPGAYQTQAVTRGDISASVGATGNIRDNQAVVLNWQTSGIISKINVTPGQTVQPNAVLAELDPSSLPQTILTAQNNLAADQKALDDLLNSDVARATAQVTLIQAQQALTTAQKSALSKQFQRASQETIDIAHANLIQAQDALNKASDTYNRNKNRDQNDSVFAAALSAFASAQQKFDQAKLNYDYVQALPDPLDVQLANANVTLAQANLLDAQRAWERVKDGPNPVDVAAAQAKVNGDQAIINQAKITTPIGGTVITISSQLGDLVSANDQAFEIGDLSHMYVDVSVSEVDVNRLQPGQDVALAFDAIANKTYQGKITNIATVGTITSSVVNYGVTVELMDRDPQIRSGMTASATFTVPGATNALLVPIRAIRTVNNARVVYVLRNGNAVPVTVTTGASTNNESAVTAGNLRDGDLLILNPPSGTATQAAGLGGIFGRMFGGGGAARPAGGGGFQIQTGGGGTNRTGGTGGTGAGGARPAGGD